MKLFVWNRVDNVTLNWHHEGGLMVVAKDLKQAREAILHGATPCPPECGALTVEPDAVYPIKGEFPVTIHAFPDAGCC